MDKEHKAKHLFAEKEYSLVGLYQLCQFLVGLFLCSDELSFPHISAYGHLLLKR